ncbi:MAG: AAA domain-containing protein, partial [Pseudomonadota bacterium]
KDSKRARILQREDADTIDLSDDDSGISDSADSSSCPSKRQSHFSTIRSRLTTSVSRLWNPTSTFQPSKRPLSGATHANTQQIRAIQSALARPAFLAVEGPPGSGKTDMVSICVLEMYLDLLENPSHSNRTILVASYTNSATDVLTDYLVKAVDRLNVTPKMLRLCSRSRKDHMSEMPPSIHHLSKSWFTDPDDTKSADQLELAVATADIIITTVSTALIRYSSLLHHTSGFRYLVIDEAGQVSAPVGFLLSTLADHTFVCGDSLQPSPHVSQQFSYIAEPHFWRLSFLQLIADLKHPTVTLKENYRSRTSVIASINRALYSNSIQAINDAALTCLIPHSPLLRCLFPNGLGVSLVSTPGCALQLNGSSSFVNASEAYCVLQILIRFVTDNNQQTLAVITPYKAQSELILLLIQTAQKAKNLPSTLPWLTVLCTDQAQGRQFDWVVLSNVRGTLTDSYNDKNSNLGFCGDFGRICVSMTRARLGTVVLLHLPSYVRNALWAEVILSAIHTHQISTFASHGALVEAQLFAARRKNKILLPFSSPSSSQQQIALSSTASGSLRDQPSVCLTTDIYTNAHLRQIGNYLLFFGQLAWPFSNHSSTCFTLPSFQEGYTFRSSEHGYLALKLIYHHGHPEAQRLLKFTSPKSAKKFVNAVLRNEDTSSWYADAAINAMETILMAKFSQDLSAKQALLNTEPLILAETTPLDCFWGTGFPLTVRSVPDPHT